MRPYYFLYDFTLSDLIEYLEDSELTQGLDRLSLLEIAIDQYKNEHNI